MKNLLLLLWPTLFIGCAASAGMPQRFSNRVLQVGCQIFSPDGRVNLVFPGDRCLLLENGDLISSTATKLSYIRKDLSIKWERSGLFHHQMNLTEDRKSILVLDSVMDKMDGGPERRYDRFLRIDLEGNVVATLDATAMLRDTNVRPVNLGGRFSPGMLRNMFDTLFPASEGSHFNSFYQLPLQLPRNAAPFLKPGGFILNGVSQGFFIVDPELKQVLYHLQAPTSSSHHTHDAQVTARGTILFFNNTPISASDDNIFSTVEEFDPKTGKTVFEMRGQPATFFYSVICGSVQELDPEYLLFSDQFGSTFIYHKKERRVVWSLHPHAKLHKGRNVVQQVKFDDLSAYLKATGH